MHKPWHQKLRAAKVDRNQPEIVKGLRALGFTVSVTSMVGKGHPDITVGYKGRTFLYEIKSEGGKLTKHQVKFHEEWAGHLKTVYSLEEIMEDIFQHSNSSFGYFLDGEQVSSTVDYVSDRLGFYKWFEVVIVDMNELETEDAFEILYDVMFSNRKFFVVYNFKTLLEKLPRNDAAMLGNVYKIIDNIEEVQCDFEDTLVQAEVVYQILQKIQSYERDIE